MVKKIRISKFTQKTVASYLGPCSYFLKWQDLWRPENTDVERRIQGEDSNNFFRQGNSPIPLLSLKKPWVVSETYSKRLNINRKPGPKASAGMSPWETAELLWTHEEPGISHYWPTHPRDRYDQAESSQDARTAQSMQIDKCDMVCQQDEGPKNLMIISQSMQKKYVIKSNETLTDQVQKDHTSAWGYAWQIHSQHCTKRETVK